MAPGTKRRLVARFSAKSSTRAVGFRAHATPHLPLQMAERRAVTRPSQTYDYNAAAETLCPVAGFHLHTLAMNS